MESWISQHWQEVLAYIGVGGGSGVLGHKAMDKQQNKKIEKLEREVARIDSELKVNTEADKQFKESINGRLGNIEELNKTILNHLLDKK